MRALMAVSADWIVAQGPHDDMGWTGRTDKKIFSLLTLGQHLACGTRTFELLRGLPIAKRVDESTYEFPGGRTLHCLRRSRLQGIVAFHAAYGDAAWLIGGITTLASAIEHHQLIHELVLCRVARDMWHGVTFPQSLLNNFQQPVTTTVPRLRPDPKNPGRADYMVTVESYRVKR